MRLRDELNLRRLTRLASGGQAGAISQRFHEVAKGLTNKTGGIDWLRGNYLLFIMQGAPTHNLTGEQLVIKRQADDLLIFYSSTAKGLVSMPHASGYVYLIADEAPQFSVMLLSYHLERKYFFGVRAQFATGRIQQSQPIILLPWGEQQPSPTLLRSMAAEGPFFQRVQQELAVVMASEFGRLLQSAA